MLPGSRRGGDTTNMADSARDPRKPLTARQKRFCEEYAADPVAVQAYFRAYGRVTSRGKKRTYKGASNSAERLLEKDGIKAEIAAVQRDYQRRCRVSGVRIVKELAAVAFFDPADAFDPDPNGGPLVARKLHEMPAAARRAMQQAKVKRRKLKGDADELYEVEEVEYKFADKLSALDKLAKRVGLYKDDDGKDAGATGAVNLTELAGAIAALITGQQLVAGGGGKPA